MKTTPADEFRFSFGRNWLSFVNGLRPEDVGRAVEDVAAWVGRDLSDRRVVDVGSGSGVHSLAFHRLGAHRVVSFDADVRSVQATKRVWRSAGSPENWAISEGSILDARFVAGLGQFDIVYAWGVLHHTGDLWNSLARTCDLVGSRGQCFVSIYAKGPRYEQHLALKRAFNRASAVGKRLMIAREIRTLMIERWRAGENPLAWNRRKERGMTVYHDLVDWLGGSPYEVASVDEVRGAMTAKGLTLERVEESPEGGCSVYLFRRS